MAATVAALMPAGSALGAKLGRLARWLRLEVALFARPAKLASLPASVSAEDASRRQWPSGRRADSGRLVAALQRHANPQLLAKPPATYDAKTVILQRYAKGLVR